MKKTTVHKNHSRKTQCEYCKQYSLFKENGSIRIIAGRLIEWHVTIRKSFCSLDCAIKYLQEVQDHQNQELQERLKK